MHNHSPERLLPRLQDQRTHDYPYEKVRIRQRQTLAHLLNALNELNQSEFRTQDLNQNSNLEDDGGASALDEQIQNEGAESFNKFQRRINNLDQELRNFANAARQLGSSVGILSTAFRLRECLANILFLFRENAADLFPRKVSRQPKETLVNPNLMKKRRMRRKGKKWTNLEPCEPERPGVSWTFATPSVRHDKITAPPFWDSTLDAQYFPEHLEVFATDVIAFLNRLNEFPEFTDEAVSTSIKAFEGDLKYWACCLRTYRGQFKYSAVQRYIHDLASEMGGHIDRITNTLRMFIEVGVPTIRYAQNHAASNLLTLSTVATFFSGVTATILQNSYDSTSTMLGRGVNAFWFSSLVLSIAAAVNSLIGLSWRMAMYRSPGHRVPWWVFIWIHRSPLVFLVMSVACFSVGLVLFTYATNQGKITSIITTVFTAFTSFGLAAVSAWFASERWTFLKYRGQKWLADVLGEAWEDTVEFWAGVMEAPPFLWSNGWATAGCGTDLGVQRTRHNDRAASLPDTIPTFGLIAETSDSSTSAPSSSAPLLLRSGPPSSSKINRIDMRSSFDAADANSWTGSSHGHASSNANIGTELLNKSSGAPPNTPITPRERFVQAVRSVIMLQKSPLFTNPSTHDFFGTARVHCPDRDLSRQGSEGGVSEMIRGSRLTNLIPKLKTLQLTEDLLAHSGLVRCLQFSPNGKFLATTSWDRTSAIFRVWPQFEGHRVLAHVQGFVSQIAWSPSGDLLLTKFNRVVKVWTEEGACRRSINRKASIQAVTWLPSGDAFMSVEGNKVIKLDLSGKVLDKYTFNRVLIHDLAVTPDSLRLLCAGPILSSPEGLQPSKSRVEKQLLVYNMQTKQIENQTPVLHDVKDITLSRDGRFVLISYEKAPPQLWTLEMVKDRTVNMITTARLVLRHAYVPKTLVDFAGHGYFGGKDDQLVLCAGKAGDIYIWDRDSAILLHNIHGQALGGDLTCLAWNRAVENVFMFATGSHDGAVRVWTTPPERGRAPTALYTPPLLTRAPSLIPGHEQQGEKTPSNTRMGGITARPLCVSPEPQDVIATPLAP
ncbi:WD40-repeat-containing domain protein [Pisolithus orientalis]|uniref:WD40-repeat-containing domain protein n=1 Tax=Pisolithus orientalis TaxID=936130 RepID=UPI0022247B29|nr:WD40-repeat-containing domain protein [Pisolithus orientalis]KAI6019824.1 WD40-repeat-containing domain protein [Pisolithus orientalis]